MHCNGTCSGLFISLKREQDRFILLKTRNNKDGTIFLVSRKCNDVVSGYDIADVRQITFIILSGIFILYFRKNMEYNMQNTSRRSPLVTFILKSSDRYLSKRIGDAYRADLDPKKMCAFGERAPWLSLMASLTSLSHSGKRCTTRNLRGALHEICDEPVPPHVNVCRRSFPEPDI